jgi:hypothetical protein
MLQLQSIVVLVSQITKSTIVSQMFWQILDSLPRVNLT